MQHKNKGNRKGEQSYGENEEKKLKSGKQEATWIRQSAGELLDIPLLDHIIIGDDGGYYSFRENEARHVSDGDMKNLEM